MSVAHADTVNVNCSHHGIDAAHADYDCLDHQNHDQTDQDECQDCCCLHSHSLGVMNPSMKMKPVPNSLMAFGAYSSLRSSVLSSLYRPPIA